MEKIATMYERDESLPGHPVKPELKRECAWVEAGEGIPTRKLDGTNVKIEQRQLYKRQKPKDRDYDRASYIPCDFNNPQDKYLFEALPTSNWEDGIYEVIGPKIQGNPEKTPAHIMYRVIPIDPSLILRDLPEFLNFDTIRNYLATHPIEGIVFHHPDGRLAKIKRRDFGLPWPATEPRPSAL